MGRRQRWQFKVRNLFIWLIVVVQLVGGFSTTVLADSASSASASVSTRNITIAQAVSEAADWLLDQGDITEDWYAYALGTVDAGDTYKSGYLASAEQRATRTTTATDYEKLVLGVKAAGGNPASFAGINLLERIYNHSDLTSSGLNGVIYGLLALNSGIYMIPADSPWNQEAMISWLLQKQITNQGWALYDTDTKADVDITGAALWALKPYKDRPAVMEAVTKAVTWLASQQQSNGDVTSDHSNAESLSMMILGLTSQQIDGRIGSFSKVSGNLISSLFTYVNSDGGFFHKVGDNQSSKSATYQAMLALQAYDSFTGGQSGTFEVPLSSGSAQSKAGVFVHIENRDVTLAEGSESAATPLEALQLLAAQNNLSVGSTDGQYFDVYQIGGVTKSIGSPFYYWGFNVKRNGTWTGDWDWKNTALHDGDEVAIFFGPYGASALLDTIELSPAKPQYNEPIQVKVKQFDNQGASVTASVYVQIGDQKIFTDSQGIAYFPDGYTAADKEISVTGALINGFPSVIRGVKILLPKVSIRVEGPQSTLVAKSDWGRDVYEALANSVTEVVYSEHPFFGVSEINDVVASGNNWWGFAVKRAGAWIQTDGWKTTAVQDGDEVLVYYSTLDTSIVKSVTLIPTEPTAGQSFSVKVVQDYWGTSSNAAGVDVQIGSSTAKTNDQGIAAFNGGFAAGVYDLTITGYRPNAAPNLVKYVSNVAIAPVATVPDDSNTVIIRVEGDESLGQILSSRSISLESGDTAYSVLVRTLGAGRVESTGTGSSLYVSGIDGLNQFDHGPQSGWKYAVNCSFPSASAGSFTIHKGDRVEWWYTKDGGDDIKPKALSSCSSSTSATVGSTAAPLTPSEIDTTISGLSINYDNQQAADPKVKTVVVLNADQRMSANQVNLLRQKLGANQAQVQQTVTASQPATLSDTQGEVMLQIPKDALSEEKAIGIQELDTQGSPELLSSMYEFTPKGTRFAKPVYVSIQLPLEGDNLDGLALAWLNETTNKWIPIPAVIDAKTGIFTGAVNHFTKFAVIDKSKLTSSTAAVDVTSAVDTAVRFVQSHADLSDWEAYALSMAGVKVPTSYLASVEALLKEKQGKLRNVTDYERLAIGVMAAGGNPRNIAGYDLIDSIVNNERMTIQGTNGPIFALLSLNHGSYKLPQALWTEEKLLQWLFQNQNLDGGWALAPGDVSNVDLTAMALVSLAPYQNRDQVKKATDKALTWLSKQQQISGGFQLSGQENSESAAQVLLALSTLKIDAAADSRFVKSGTSVISNLLSYQQSDGGFAHAIGEASGNISTEQALLALSMYQRMTKNLSAPSTEIQFTDKMDISTWASGYVQKAVKYGLMEGMSEKEVRFAPKEPLTRAQFVTMMLRLKGIQPMTNAKESFVDVKPESWYFGNIAKAIDLGYVNGLSDDTFAPDQSITRQDMAVLISRILLLTSSSNPSDKFSDLSEAYGEAVPAIRSVSENGYMEGDDQGRFIPSGWVTREMAAAVMVRVYEKQTQ